MNFVDKICKLATEFEKLAHRCNCENSKCSHEPGDCKNKAGDKKAMYVGAICDSCAANMPDKYMKNASDNNDAKKKKLDPKAKVRNRGTVCVPAESAKDKKDHFPINDEDQARNALARVHQYSSVPSWYSGSLKSLQNTVSRKVHSKYPSIGKSDKKKKDCEVSEALLAKYGQ